MRDDGDCISPVRDDSDRVSYRPTSERQRDLGRCYQLDTGMSSNPIRDVAARTLRSLKLLARSHHRSLQGELQAIPARASRMAAPEAEEQRLQLVTVKTEQSSRWSRDTIYGDDGR